jgi:hypothetical protein
MPVFPAERDASEVRNLGFIDGQKCDPDKIFIAYSRVYGWLPVKK